jgi:predicted phosphoribosyltransferase
MVRHADFQEPYRDRRHAGTELARHLADLKGQDVVVLALPRGGVPVAFEVARALDAPLDVFVVRKLGLPWSCRIRDRRHRLRWRPCAE